MQSTDAGTADQMIDSSWGAEEWLEFGNSLFAQGDFKAARQAYRSAHRIRPDQISNYSLGLVEEASDAPDEAATYYAAAVAADPGFVAARVNLAHLLRRAGQALDAMHHMVYAHALAPHHPLTAYGVAEAALALGRVDLAARLIAAHPDIDHSLVAGIEDRLTAGTQPCTDPINALVDSLSCSTLEHIVAVQADDIAAWTDLGNSQLAEGRAEDAIALQRHALSLDPLSLAALNNHAVALRAAGRSGEAIQPLLVALALKPDWSLAWTNLGQAWQASGRPEFAFDAFTHACRDEDAPIETLAALAETSRQLGRHCRALAVLERIAARQADNYMVHNNRGAYLLDTGQAEAALESFEKAARLKPDAAMPLSNCGAACELLGRHADARRYYERALRLAPGDISLRARFVHVSQHLCDWAEFDAHCASLLDAHRRESDAIVPPFTLLAVPGASSADMLTAARRYGRQFVGSADQPGRRTTDGKIRVGYLSSDLYGHATAWLIAEILEQHDAARFDVHLYSYGQAPEDDMRARLRRACPVFVDLHGLSDSDAAARIRADGIDILIDLKGYTRGARPQILAFRPAPIQINYLGFPGSMGVEFVDHIIADDVIIPPELEGAYSEKVLRLPNCYQPNDRRRPLPPAPPRESVGLPDDALVFCSFNAAYKLTPHMLDIWCDLLRKVKGSVLWLLSSDPVTNSNLRREAVARDIDPARLVFAPRTDLQSHLARFRCADLFLDSFPCTAHTTASDALWCGVPVITRVGDTFASRVAASVVSAAGLGQLIARSDEDYTEIALALARQPGLLDACKSHLDEVRFTCPLFDSQSYTRDLEQLYGQLVATPGRPS